MTYRALLAAWVRRRMLQAADLLHGRPRRRWAFKLRWIRAAFAERYDPWDLQRWMADQTD